MVSTVGAAVGEAVTGSVIRDFRRRDSSSLRRLRGQGLSDQKVALIDIILNERKGGKKFSQRELIRGLAETRRPLSEKFNFKDFKEQFERERGASFSPERLNEEFEKARFKQQFQRGRQASFSDARLNREFEKFKRQQSKPEEPIPEPRKTTGSVSAVTPTTFFGKNVQAIRGDIAQLESKRRSGTITPSERASLALLTGLKPFEETLELGERIVRGTPQFLKKTPEVTKEILTNPKESIRKAAQIAASIPVIISESAETAGKNLQQVSPEAAIGRGVGEAVFLLTGGKVVKVSGDALEKGLIFADKATGKLKIVETLPSGRQVIKNLPSKNVGSRSLSLEIAEEVPTLSLKQQAALAGEDVTAVSGARDFFNLFKRERVVRKSIPNAEKLSDKTRDLLKKFDEGKLPTSRIPELDRRIKQESGAKGLLEVTFFADPSGKLRPSRLGIRGKEGEATLSDIIKGDVTFRKQKPQAIVFEERIAKFPEELKDIQKALSEGKELTKSQAERLLKFQLKKTGEFKPIGFVSREAEVVLAPGEIIKKSKSLGTTVIKGKRVPIIRAEVVKATKETRELLQKLRTGRITGEEIDILKKRLAKETGFTQSEISSSLFSGKKFVSPIASSIALIRRATPKSSISFSKRTIPKSSISFGKKSKPFSSKLSKPSKLTSKKVISPTKSPFSPTSPSKPIIPKSPFSSIPPSTFSKSKFPTSPSPPFKTARPPSTPPIIKRPLSFKPARLKKLKPKDETGYFTFYKRRGKFLKINKKPITKSQALDLGAEVADRTLANTFRIRKANRKATKPNIRIRKNYFRNTQNKFRDFRISKGKRIPLKNTFIEKRGKPRLDTATEKRRIQAAAYLARQKKPLIKLRSVKFKKQ